ncbi:DUF3710 domain-containing protein [Pseudofrankia inefficax]|uniref:DUF3710 domain-containing protein n=1 Tax=Pseudofrankia inefficax (strain DSM 45817 / CECT 9037 / DDB 130130 / EuI1c) TaxID=298654 RepID=UPI0012FDD102|nr:DUF3710 domain-containing protein [Pseudofrankia inefficax]
MSPRRREPRGAVEPEPPPAAGDGPYDLADTPCQAVRRLDLGCLLVPELPGVVYRFEVTGTGDQRQVVAAVAVADGSQMRLTAHAAPRGGGLADEVRAELLRSALPAGATPASVTAGPFGPELWTEAPAAEAGAAGGLCRLLSIDGPRWLLLAAITTPAGTAPAATDEPGPTSRAPGMPVLEEVLRAAVVVRGERAMPAGAALALKLPTEPDPPDSGVDDRGDPDALADELGRLPPIGAATADPRRISYEVVAAPAGGLSRNRSTWG